MRLFPQRIIKRLLNYTLKIFFRTIIDKTPGIPSAPIINAVIKFNAMLKFIKFPIKFIIKIAIPPSIELNISFTAIFIGIAKNLPKKKKIIIPDK